MSKATPQSSPVIQASVVSPQQYESDEARQERIRTLAYLKWLAATDGNPVSEEETATFWFKAEQELSNKE